MTIHAPNAVFQRAGRQFSAMLAELQAIQPTELSLEPRSVQVTAVGVDCRNAVRIVAEFVRARMKDVEWSTGVDMEAKNADWIIAGYDEWCDPKFGEALRALSPPPAYVVERPGLEGTAP